MPRKKHSSPTNKQQVGGARATTKHCRTSHKPLHLQWSFWFPPSTSVLPRGQWKCQVVSPLLQASLFSFRAQSLEKFQCNEEQYAQHPPSQLPVPNRGASFWNPVANPRSRVPHSTKLLVPARLFVKVYKIITTDSYLCMWKLHSSSGIF